MHGELAASSQTWEKQERKRKSERRRPCDLPFQSKKTCRFSRLLCHCLLIRGFYLREWKTNRMGSRGNIANMVLSRASRIRAKLQSALEASVLEIEDVSHQHAGHAAVKESGGAGETHFNLKIVSSKFEGQSLVKRHRMVYDAVADELQSGLHALSIVAKTPNEATGAGTSRK